MTMNIRRSFFWFITVVLVLLALALWFTTRKPVETPLTSSVETNAAPSANVSAPGPQPGAPALTNAQAAKVTGGTPLSKSQPESKAERMAGILAAYNDERIVFYGRVEDQFTSAVAHAAVNFDVRVYNGTESTVNRGQVMTDGNGYFTISGYKGESLGLVPAKTGYALATTSTFFRYSRMDDQHYVPDQNKLPYTSEPINFDLLAQTLVPSGGDVKLTVNRTPGDISGRNRLDWSVRVEAVDGGVMDSAGQDRVAYAAPDNGYQPGITFNFSTNAPYKWAGGFTQGFFLRSRNGQVYSKLGLSFDINDASDGFMSITFGGVANTNGSRNWEGDPNTYKPQ